MKIIVTGGAGFIGSNICRRLVQEGMKVCVLDNFSTGSKKNLNDIKDDVEIIQGDIRDNNLLKYAFKGADHIFHQAALPSVKRSIENPIACTGNNIDGTVQVLWAAYQAGVKRVVLASSSSIYGETPVLPKHEKMLPDPKSPYALSKYTLELYSRMFSRIYGLETVCLRYFNVFGPYQNPHSEYSAVIPKFLNQMKNGKAPVIYGDGGQTRDFCYIDNVVNANMLALVCKLANGEGINIGCGERISLLELVAILNGFLGTSLMPHYLPSRTGDVRNSLADIALAKDILGYEPMVKVREGIKKLIDWSNESSTN